MPLESLGRWFKSGSVEKCFPCIRDVCVLSDLLVQNVCQKWDSNPRPHSWTRMLHALRVERESTLESGALDRSAILTLSESDIISCRMACVVGTLHEE